MADAFTARDIESEAHDTSNNVGHVSTTSPQKRKSENVVDGEPTEKKKFAMNFNMKKNTDGLKKIPINIGSNLKLGAIPIKMSLSSQKPKEIPVAVKPRTAAVAKAFNEDDDSDEEMPPEAKMRMRNIGRDTPTAAGPKSFGKSRLGFCDRQRMVEKEIIKNIEDAGED